MRKGKKGLNFPFLFAIISGDCCIKRLFAKFPEFFTAEGAGPMKNILFVCTGNTCRSPMAEGLFRRMAPEGAYSVSSAGVFARKDDPASEEAVAVMAEKGIDLSGHRARLLTCEMVDQADLICCMTPTHAARLLGAFPQGEEKLLVWNIPDPFGGDDEIYRACARHLEEQVKTLLADLEA